MFGDRTSWQPIFWSRVLMSNPYEVWLAQLVTRDRIWRERLLFRGSTRSVLRVRKVRSKNTLVVTESGANLYKTLPNPLISSYSPRYTCNSPALLHGKRNQDAGCGVGESPTSSSSSPLVGLAGRLSLVFLARKT